MKLKNTSSPESWTPPTRRKMRELFDLVYKTLIYTWSKAENSFNPRLEPLAIKDRVEFENNFLKRCERKLKTLDSAGFRRENCRSIRRKRKWKFLISKH